MKTLIRNGRLALEDRLETGDVLLQGEKILAVGGRVAEPVDRVIDASGCYVLPGLIDFHVHMDDRIGAFELADSYESGSRIAIQNGITTLCSFVTQGAGESLVNALERARGKAFRATHGDLLWHLTPTTFADDDWRQMERLVALGYRTFKFYTTYKDAGIFADSARLEEVFRRLGPLGVRFLVHCEDDALMAELPLAGMDLSQPTSHAKLRPEAAERSAVEAMVTLAHRTGVSLHVVHVSTAGAAKCLAESRSETDLSCETCPQYLWLDEGWLAREDGHRWLCSPPLREERDLFRGLAQEGVFDLIATDHCAFRRGDKDAWDHRDVRTAANGIAGLGALPHLAWRLWEGDPDRAAMEVARRLSRNPAILAGIGHRKGSIQPGLDADLVVLNFLDRPQSLISSHADTHETYPGFTTTLNFQHVLLRGDPKVADGILLHSETPTGQMLQAQP